MNDLNLSLQEIYINIFASNKKIEACLNKIEFWEKKVKKIRFDMFSSSFNMMQEKIINEMKNVIAINLLKLKDKYFKYFDPTYNLLCKNKCNK